MEAGCLAERCGVREAPVLSGGGSRERPASLASRHLLARSSSRHLATLRIRSNLTFSNCATTATLRHHPTTLYPASPSPQGERRSGGL